MMRLLRNGLVVPYTILLLLITVPANLLWSSRRSVILRRFHKAWAAVVFPLLKVSVAIHGEVPLPDEAPCVVVSNHQGYLDSPALVLAVSRRSWRFIAKESLFKVPLMGWFFRSSGFVSVRRSDRDVAIRSLGDVRSRITDEGLTLMAYPEGTRTRDGRVGPFKKGPFVLAIQAQVPIIPAAISGSFQALPRSRIFARPGTITVRLLEPVETAGLSYDHRDRLMEEVRSRIVESVEGEAEGGI